VNKTIQNNLKTYKLKDLLNYAEPSGLHFEKRSKKKPNYNVWVETENLILLLKPDRTNLIMYLR